MGLLTEPCQRCGHRHGKLTHRCTRPGCGCLGRRGEQIRRRLYPNGQP